MKTKVLMFGWEFPPHNSGGLGTACMGLTKGLAQEGLDVIFVLPKRVDARSDSARIVFADIQNVVFESAETLIYPYITSEIYKKNRAEVFSPLYGRSLIEEVILYGKRACQISKSHDFDVIHAHDWLSFKAGLNAKAQSGKPLVVHVHATEFDRCGGRNINRQVYEIEKEGMEGADCIAAVSQWTKDIIVKEYGIEESKIEVVHNGIDTSEFRTLPKILEDVKSKGNKVVSFVGRVTVQKGPDYFIKAAAKVLSVREKTFFVLSGTGDMLDQMIRLSADLGISDRMIFTGFLRGDELNSLYQSSDLFVLSSVSEPFGLTPLEAIANGTPVLVSKQSGVSEVLSHALKYDFWDIDDMADKIVSILDHNVLHENLKANSGREILRTDWKATAKKCVMLYNKLRT